MDWIIQLFLKKNMQVFFYKKMTNIVLLSIVIYLKFNRIPYLIRLIDDYNNYQRK